MEGRKGNRVYISHVDFVDIDLFVFANGLNNGCARRFAAFLVRKFHVQILFDVKQVFRI